MGRFAFKTRLAAAALALGCAGSAQGQAPQPPALPGPGSELRDVPITGDGLGGFVIPVRPVESDIRLVGTTCWRWTSDDTLRLQLEGDVKVDFAGYAFAARSAVVWINRIPSAQGLINQIAVYFPEVHEPTRRAGLGASGSDLFVTGSTRGEVVLSCVLPNEGAPPPNPALSRGAARLRDYLVKLSKGARLRTQPLVERPVTVPEPPIEVGAPVVPPEPPPPPQGTVRKWSDAQAIFNPEGTIAFSGGDVSVDTKEDIITITGSVIVEYESRNATAAGGELQLSAERAVIFMREGALESMGGTASQLSAADVLGIYLEGDVVATDFEYTLRGRRVYYDLLENRAVVVDAVLRTYTRDGVPLYARAAELRQVAKDDFVAENARVSMSEFFTPHLSIGAERVTITQSPGDAKGSVVEATHVMARAGDVPFLWWPYLKGSPQDIPLKGVAMGFNDFRGVEVESRWDLFSLLGWERPTGMDVELIQEAYSKNGVGGGARIRGTALGGTGELSAIGLYDFGNEEQTIAGGTVENQPEWRGALVGDWMGYLTSDMTIQTQLSVISDQNYISTFRWEDYLNRREYETSAFLRSQSGNSSFSLLGKFNPQNFISNGYMMASRPYYVDKLPEIAYRRLGDSLFGDSLSWTQEWSGSVMNLQVTSGSPNSLGIQPRAFSQNSAFGRNQNINAAYTAAGYDDNYRGRVWTRHELAYPFMWERLKITPFGHISGAAYMGDSFALYSTEAEKWRVLAGGGARISTEFTSNYDSVRSDIFDINRLRHVVQPRAILWGGWDSNSVLDTPIYDQDIEGQSGAVAAMVAVTQKLQTMRGGPGNWRSVDWVVLDVGASFDNQGNTLQRSFTAADPFGLRYAQAPNPTFYEWRPELSQWGDHLFVNLKWQLSDAVAAYGSGTYLFEDGRGNSINSFGLDNLGRGTLGVSVRQSPDVTVYAEYRYVNTFDPSGRYPADELLQFGANYQISKAYTLAVTPQYDLVAHNMRAISGTLTRNFPDFLVSVGASYNQIIDQATFFVNISVGGRGFGTSFNPDAPDGTPGLTGLPDVF